MNSRQQTTNSKTGTIIRLESVEKVYHVGNEDVRALAGVTTTIGYGSFWAIMGPSGSGKSTMLNLLGCLDQPTAGKYFFEDQDVNLLDDNGLSELRLRKLGFIFQSFNLIPQLTVKENIELPLFYLNWDPKTTAGRAADLAEMVGLGDRFHHRPMELSGGQQQRVAFARALANNPEVLLADEPTGNLDSTTSAQIMQLLVDLHKSGKTIIMVTHEHHLAAFAEKRLLMRDGRIDHIEA